MPRTGPRPHYGSKRRVHVSGYIDIFQPDHPLARSDGWGRLTWLTHEVVR